MKKTSASDEAAFSTDQPQKYLATKTSMKNLYTDITGKFVPIKIIKNQKSAVKTLILGCQHVSEWASVNYV